MIPLGRLGYIGRCEGYDMECIDRIQELRVCVACVLFYTCLLHRLRGPATAFLRMDANEAQT